jgi:hypothetical protein
MFRGGDLPIEQSAKFGLLIAQGPRRQQVVRALRLTIPQSILLRPDAVTE